MSGRGSVVSVLWIITLRIPSYELRITLYASRITSIVSLLSLYLRGGKGVPWREGECYVTLLILRERYDVMLTCHPEFALSRRLGISGSHLSRYLEMFRRMDFF
mgnify:CR=1 FL=1